MERYPDFKSYLQANYRDLLTCEVQKFVDGPPSSGEFLINICRERVENLEIKTIYCREDIGPYITIDVNVSADVILEGLGSKHYDVSRSKRWFTVFLRAILKNGLNDVVSLDVKEYYGSTFEKEGALDEYLIPYIYAVDLEDVADDFTMFYCDETDYDGWQCPLQMIMQEMGISYYEADLPPDEFGRMYFKPATIKTSGGANPAFVSRPTRVQEEIEVQPGTMVISKTNYFMTNVGSRLHTIAHEIIHWEKHQKFFELLTLLNYDEDMMSCKTSPDISPDNLVGIQKAVWWAEWQANALAPRILMPRVIFNDQFPKLYAEQLAVSHNHTGDVMEATLKRIADSFGVTKEEAKLRALQLGYKCAEGAFIRVDGHYMTPYSFNPIALGKYQTFILDRVNYKRMMQEDPNFAGLINNDEFIYLGYVVCINDPVYIRPTKNGEYGQYALTDYALENIDECCLKFTRLYEINHSSGDYYSQCYLCQNINASAFSESKKVDTEDRQDKEEKAKELEKLRKEGEKVMSIYRNLPNSFAGTLDMHMKRLKAYNAHTENYGKMTNVELSSRTGLSEDYIGQLRKDGKGVRYETVCAICIALHLHPIFSEDLMRKAHTDYPDDDEGFFGRYLIQHQYTNSLEECNKLLAEQGYRIWGKATAA